MSKVQKRSTTQSITLDIIAPVSDADAVSIAQANRVLRKQLEAVQEGKLAPVAQSTVYNETPEGREEVADLTTLEMHYWRLGGLSIAGAKIAAKQSLGQQAN